MKQYIWFHPLYVNETSPCTVAGQTTNALNNNYIVLSEKDLHNICATDHLTIVGHSTAPKDLLQDEDEDTDTGLFIQGETAAQCVDRLKSAGLSVPPKILSLECCKAGVRNGLAETISSHAFFQNSLIESTNGSVGRNPGKAKWPSFPLDSFGRALLHSKSSQWIFFHREQIIATRQHGDYQLQDILQIMLPRNCHEFFSAEKAIASPEAAPDSAAAQSMNSQL